MGGSQPTVKYTKERNLDSLAQLSYQLDFSQDKGWLKWLGRHNVSAFLERRDMTVTSLTGRELNVSDYAWTAVNDLASLPLRGNVYRIDYAGGPMSQWAWSPASGRKYHTMAGFGVLRF